MHALYRFAILLLSALACAGAAAGYVYVSLIQSNDLNSPLLFYFWVIVTLIGALTGLVIGWVLLRRIPSATGPALTSADHSARRAVAVLLCIAAAFGILRLGQWWRECSLGIRDAMYHLDENEARRLHRFTPYPDDETALVAGALLSDRATVVRALRNGLRADTVVKGRTALMMAAYKGNTDLAILLLDRGADPNLLSPDGRTALWFAAEGRHPEMIATLLRRGAQPDVRGNHADTPLMRACDSAGHAEASARPLLAAGAGLGARDNHGCTPLFRAEVGWEPGLVRALLEHGADPNARDRYGRTPLGYMGYNWRNRRTEDYDQTEYDKQQAAILQVLISHGAEVDASARTGVSLLRAARMRGYKACAQVLTAHGCR